jgi:DNA-binding XRE family transcriptional regulator
MTKRRKVAGAKTLAEMKAKLTPAERAAVKKRVAVLAQEEMTLADLRKAQNITQAALAQKLGIKQATVSQVESSIDLYLSTLRKHIEAMGGELTLMAQFPNRPPVVIADIRRNG